MMMMMMTQHRHCTSLYRLATFRRVMARNSNSNSNSNRPLLSLVNTGLYQHHHQQQQHCRNLSSSSHEQHEQQHAKYPRLFSSLDLGPDIGLLPNRVIMGSMHTGLEGNSMPSFLLPLLGETKKKHHHHHHHHHAKHQQETEDNDNNGLHAMAMYFAERAAGGVGLCVTGGIAPNRQGWTGPFSSKLTTEDEMQLHVCVTRAVHEQNVPTYHNNTDGHDNVSTAINIPGRICLQILHTGRYAYHPFAVSASTTKSPISPFQAKAMSAHGIASTIRDFVHTAELAKRAGYDGVEIMASEGYLLSQFLSPCTNHRTDQYGSSGGSIENRARMALEIIRQTRSSCGPDFIIIFRLSLMDLVPNGIHFDESVALCHEIQAAGATILNTGIGWHEARVPTIATSVPRGAFAFTTIQLKQRLLEQGVDIPLCATNRINHPATAENVLMGRIGLSEQEQHQEHRNNTNIGADLVSMARPFLADAALMQKSRNGQEDEINTCIACNQACLDHVFVGKVASCLVNPRACHEVELPNVTSNLPQNQLPVEQRFKIGVVGAGPAGCAFAITAAQLGHEVTLFDQDTSIGGQFHMAKRIPGKEEFHETLRYFTTMLKKHNVKVQLQTRMDYKDMVEMTGIDKWINATGVNPRNTNIPGQDAATNVVSYIDVLKHKVPIGKRVAVIGAGGIGFDVSEYLLHWKGPHDKMANDVSYDDFYKEWGIDTTLASRGGLLTEPAGAAGAAATHDDVAQPERQLYLIQRKKGKLGAGLGKTTGWIHRATLNNSGRVEMINGATYEKIDENGHLHISQTSSKDKDGKTTTTTTRILQVDHIVICAGQVEKPDLQNNKDTTSTTPAALQNRLYTIGGAYEAGELDAKRAIDMGTRLAMKIHEPDCVPGTHVDKPLPGVEEKLFAVLRRFM